jgi:3-hydroxyacyl-CoA dehydrogenase
MVCSINIPTKGRKIMKIGVIGSGVMGSGIAAQAANGGLEVLLLDIIPEGALNRSQLASDAIQKQLKSGGFTHPKRVPYVTAGNLEDDLGKLAECDWIIEVVTEKLTVKHAVYQKIDAVRKEGSIVSSNTSTLPLAKLMEGMSERFKRDFMITHFFNPPRVMRLLEVVASPHMEKKRFENICEVADRVFGKTIVPCKDTAGFIANRIGVYWMTCAMNKALTHDIRMEEVDALLGKPIGVPRTAVFGLYDLIGIDLMPLIADAMRQTLQNTDAFFALEPKPPLIAKMIETGFTGRKGKGGFYKMEKLPDGSKTMLALDLSTGEYHPALTQPLLASASTKNIKALLATDDMGGAYARDVMVHALHYAASLIPEIADSIADVDTAMKFGYSWKFGPFELIDQIGVEMFTNYCEQMKLTVPPIILAAHGKSLYSPTGTMGLDGAYHPKHKASGTIALTDLNTPVIEGKTSKLWELGDGVMCFEITTKMHTIDHDVLNELEAALEWVRTNARALVIGSDTSLFSAGANIHYFVDNARNDAMEKVESIITHGQAVMLKIKHAPFPVVSALTGIALGGGCETLLHSHAVQAHAEVRTGLVEVNVGVVPAWGGCKEMLLRHVATAPDEKTALGKLVEVFANIVTAKTANSADEAIDLGIVQQGSITMNSDRLLADAKQCALQLIGKQRTLESSFSLPTGGKAALEAWLAERTATLSPHTLVIAKKLITVLTNNDHTHATEQQILDLEREAFIALMHTKETQARIDYMLEHGKPLFN